MRDAGLDFDESNDYDWIKTNYFRDNYFDEKIDHVGYAGYYLEKMRHKTVDASLYRKLVDIDTGLGTKASDQLFVCLTLSSKPEFIKVRIYFFFNYSPSKRS